MVRGSGADLTNQRFGKLLVIKEILAPKARSRRWLCLCDCGNYTEVYSSNLCKTNNPTKGCSCRLSEVNRLRPYEAIYNQLRKNAINAVIPYLSYEEFIIYTDIKECFYCGAKITWTKYTSAKGNWKYNLDKKDSSKGYTIDNLVVCCKLCNYTKGNRFTYEQFILIGNVIRGFYA